MLHLISFSVNTQSANKFSTIYMHYAQLDIHSYIKTLINDYKLGSYSYPQFQTIPVTVNTLRPSHQIGTVKLSSINFNFDIHI